VQVARIRERIEMRKSSVAVVWRTDPVSDS